MTALPKISIITPAYDCGKYIRRCIESVLAQGYPHFEHIVCDGGSKDETVEILKSYQHINWVSEPDKGECDALNKALPKVTGDFVLWLNADDWLEREVFTTVVRNILLHPEEHVIYGNTNMVDEQDKLLWLKKSDANLSTRLLIRWWLCDVMFHQPSMFISSRMIREVGPFNQDLHFSIDLEYWIRLSLKCTFLHVDQVFSNALQRDNAKSSDTVPQQQQSHWKVVLPYLAQLDERERVYFWLDYYSMRLYQPSPYEGSRLPTDDDSCLALLMLLTIAKLNPADANLAALFPLESSRNLVTSTLEGYLARNGQEKINRELSALPFG